MRDWNVYGNVLDTMEAVAENHRIHLDMDLDKSYNLVCKDDEGNTWKNNDVFSFFSEFIIDTSLCTKEQLQQIQDFAKARGMEETGLEFLFQEFDQKKVSEKSSETLEDESSELLLV